MKMKCVLRTLLFNQFFSHQTLLRVNHCCVAKMMQLRLQFFGLYIEKIENDSNTQFVLRLRLRNIRLGDYSYRWLKHVNLLNDLQASVHC
jgi:hypothetical protein